MRSIKALLVILAGQVAICSILLYLNVSAIFFALFAFVSVFIMFFVMRTRSKYLEADLERKKSERDLILNSLLEGVVVVAESGTIEYANAAAGRMLKVSKKNLEGNTFSRNSGQILADKASQLLASCNSMQVPLTDSIVMEKEKKTHLDLIAIPQIDMKQTILIFQDQSSQHKILEVGKDFISSASHELKTPITIIRGFTETLQDMKDLPKEIVEDILEKIVRNCHRMDTLVKNLLTLADIENIPLCNTQSCDLEALVEECKRVVMSVYPEAKIEIISHTSVIAKVEPSLLELAILNLLGNAVKYSKSPAEVTVVIDKNPDEIVIKVKDQGLGIPAKDLDHIFDRFYTVNKAHSRKLGGAGLGLSLVKTIIEKHEGSILAESTLGEGSEFTVCLPAHLS